MKRRAFMFVLILILAVSVCSTCLAFSPTPTPSPMPPTPTPTPSPTPTALSRDSCSNHIHLSVRGLTSEPKKHLLYSHENGIMADGFLMFMPLEEYVEWEKIPAISRNQFLSARLSVDTYVESFSCNTAFYLKTENGLNRIEDKTASLSDLPDGTYLVRMDCNAAHKGVAYRFYYLFWVN